jgi:hypothetical protein
MRGKAYRHQPKGSDKELLEQVRLAPLVSDFFLTLLVTRLGNHHSGRFQKHTP